ncbi:MAG: hypothetical protein M3P30_00530 [Chloroflexota bacterium]|nr:hypothetical protein [Chloroflexota bacterium]
MTTDRKGNTIRYGRINREMIGRWLQLPSEDDGPFWALNLMKYRDVAQYSDGRSETRRGREADDEYTPRESLAAVGAQIAFAAEVERVLVGDGTAWDRIGIVRYPRRRMFLEMQQREDFKKQHVHKDAGMEFTVVMSCLPVTPFTGSTDRRPFVELRVSAEAAPAEAGAGIFDVEGVIVGDERVWRQASFRWLDRAAEASAAGADDRSTYVMLLRPGIDRLSRSVHEASVGAETPS